jgi:hypothetical protein
MTVTNNNNIQFIEPTVPQVPVLHHMNLIKPSHAITLLNGIAPNCTKPQNNNRPSNRSAITTHGNVAPS